MNYVVVSPIRPNGEYNVQSWKYTVVKAGSQSSWGTDTLEEALKVAKSYGLPVRMSHECVVCGEGYPEPFMVHNHVWKAAGLGRGRAHIGCFQEQLGRPLVLEDFKPDVPINEVFWFAVELGAAGTPES